MRCEYLIGPDGKSAAIVCGSRQRTIRCQVSGCHKPSTKQCDYPVQRQRGGKGTCDLYLCDAHAEQAGEDLDHCPTHARAMAKAEQDMLAELGAADRG